MKKQLDETKIVNELRDASAFFTKPRQKEKQAQSQPEKEARADYANRALPLEAPLPTHRLIKQHEFGVFVDQIEALNLRKAEQTIKGEKVSISRMVRQAIDEFLEAV